MRGTYSISVRGLESEIKHKKTGETANHSLPSPPLAQISEVQLPFDMSHGLVYVTLVLWLADRCSVSEIKKRKSPGRRAFVLGQEGGECPLQTERVGAMIAQEEASDAL